MMREPIILVGDGAYKGLTQVQATAPPIRVISSISVGESPLQDRMFFIWNDYTTLVIRFYRLQLVKQSIDEILTWDFDRVIMGHGKIVETNAKQELAAGYQWLVS